MKCLVLCVIVLLCGISGGQAKPQGFFGGLLLPASSHGEGGSPSKGPPAIFTQAQQTVQNRVGEFVSGLGEIRKKIRNETEKYIQSLQEKIGNRNKQDSAVISEKPEEAVPEKEDKEVLPEKPEQEPIDNKEKESSKNPEKESQPDSNDKKEPHSTLEKLKQNESNDKMEPLEKEGATKNLTPTSPSMEATTIDSAEVDKLIEDVFANSDPSQDGLKEKEGESEKEGGKG